MSDAAHAFSGSVPELYDRYMGPTFFEPFARELAGRFEGFTGDILETAAGTGRVTRRLAEAAPRATITATDLNEPMLARATATVTAPNVHWRQADALALPFEDASFDAVICQFGAMFFPDKVAGYAEARRVLRGGGRFVFSVWDRLETNDMTDVVEQAAAAVFPADPPRFFSRVPFGYHDGEAIRRALNLAGFRSVEAERVQLPTPAESAAEAALGLVNGTPLYGEIQSRDPGRLDATIEAATRALETRFGRGKITGTGQALVFTVGAA